MVGQDVGEHGVELVARERADSCRELVGAAPRAIHAGKQRDLDDARRKADPFARGQALGALPVPSLVGLEEALLHEWREAHTDGEEARRLAVHAMVSLEETLAHRREGLVERGLRFGRRLPRRERLCQHRHHLGVLSDEEIPDSELVAEHERGLVRRRAAADEPQEGDLVSRGHVRLGEARRAGESHGDEGGAQHRLRWNAQPEVDGHSERAEDLGEAHALGSLRALLGFHRDTTRPPITTVKRRGCEPDGRARVALSEEPGWRRSGS
jgi:hypothetical protein